MSDVHVRLKEWQSLGPDVEPLRGASLDSQSDRSLARELTRSGILEVTELRGGIAVKARAHVGRIGIGRLVVTVEPKVGTSELLQLLRYAYGLRQLRLYERTEFAHAGDLLQDLLATQLLAEVNELTSRGLHKRYVEHEEHLASPRGRIDFLRMATRGQSSSASLPCRHHLRSPDHHLNATVRAGLRLAAGLAQDPGLRRSLVRLDATLALEIEDLVLTRHVLARAQRQLNRLTTAYGPALQITQLLFDSAAVSLGEGGETRLSGFLFDMNRFFQALVGRFLSENLEGFTVDQERSLGSMMRFVPGMNPRRRQSPNPRPDFSVMRGRAVVCLLDAKYRDLWARTLPPEMLYQLAMYAMSQPGSATAAILYPTVSVDASAATVEIRDPVRGDAMAYVELRPVHLGMLGVSLGGTARERAGIARGLAFGSRGPRQSLLG